MPMPTGNGENPQFYGQWTVEDSQNGLWAKKFTKTKNSISLDSKFVDLENTGERVTLIATIVRLSVTIINFSYTQMFPNWTLHLYSLLCLLLNWVLHHVNFSISI